MADFQVTGSPGGTVPEYIGYAGHQLTSQMKDDGVPDKLFEEQMQDKMVFATIKPLLTTISKDANVYRPRDAFGEFASDLANVGIGINHQYLKVVLSTFTPVTETYKNDYGDSEILNSANRAGGKLSELIRLTGAKDVTDLKTMIKKDSALGALAGNAVELWEKGVNTLKNAGTSLAESGHETLGGITEAVGRLAASPWSKIGWPAMWKNCSFQASYELCTRLYCYNTDNTALYRDTIAAPIAALQMFVQPRSEDGMLYTSPFMMEFAIPGSIYYPLAYASDMTVIKGGDTGDFAQNGRPNVVDIRMTIQNVFGISTNTTGQDAKYSFRPSVKREQQVLNGGKRLHKPSQYGKGSDSPPENDSSKNAPDSAISPKDVESKINKYRQNRAKSIDQQEAADAFQSLDSFQKTK